MRFGGAWRIASLWRGRSSCQRFDSRLLILGTGDRRQGERRSGKIERVSDELTLHDPVLAEQLAYYRARAAEYDTWFRREGLYDWGEVRNAMWLRELEQVRSALDEFAPEGDVLELAYGTGEWTLRLADRASTLIGIDGSPEMRDLALAKLELAGHVQLGA
jgi:SAM-dependent methyltransferase